MSKSSHGGRAKRTTRKSSAKAVPVSRTVLISKSEIASIFEDMASLLEITGANVFKVRAFTNAARELESLPGDLVDMVNSGDLLEVPGIGKSIFGHIREILETGTFEDFEKLRADIPPGLLEMLRIPGVGPKKVKTIHDTLGVETVGELEKAANDGLIAPIPGFGEKSQEKILGGIERMRRYRRRHLLNVAADAAQRVYASVAGHPDVHRSLLGGSLRRGLETVKDIDILVSAEESDGIMNALVSAPGVASVTAKGSTKTSVVLDSGINVDLRVVKDDEFAFAALYFTGSKEHNTDMRARAKKRGFKLNEYGLFRDEEATPCDDEATVFEKLGLAYIPPELRESMGEIDAAEKDALPTLIELGDVKGLMHVHTKYSDGRASLAAMAEAAKDLDMEYIGVADHSRSAELADGMSVDAVREQAEEIARLNAALDRLTVLHGVESEILPDGSLDYDDDVLAGLDFVIAALHDPSPGNERETTDRLVTAIAHPYTTILAHPTNRLLLEREGYRIDINRVIDACATHDVMVEINAHPSRLDLDWRLVRAARDRGVTLVIGLDAHDTAELENYWLGVTVARKGWLTAGDVLNTRGIGGVKEMFARKRGGG